MAERVDSGAGRGSTRGEPDAGAAARFVAALAASACRVPAAALMATGRGPARVAFARQLAMYLAHVRLGLNFSRIGAAFGRDRTTAAHACRTIEERRDDRSTDAIVEMLERALDAWPPGGGLA